MSLFCSVSVARSSSCPSFPHHSSAHPPPQPASQPASRRVPFISVSHSTLSLPCLTFSFFLSPCPHCSPSLSNVVTASPPRCATQVIYSEQRVAVLVMLRGGPSRAPLEHTHTHFFTAFSLTFKHMHADGDTLKPFPVGRGHFSPRAAPTCLSDMT